MVVLHCWTPVQAYCLSINMPVICELLWQDIRESWPIRDLMDHLVRLETETRLEVLGSCNMVFSCSRLPILHWSVSSLQTLPHCDVLNYAIYFFVLHCKNLLWLPWIRSKTSLFVAVVSIRFRGIWQEILMFEYCRCANLCQVWRCFVNSTDWGRKSIRVSKINVLMNCILNFSLCV